MNFELSDEQKSYQAAARQFAQKALAPMPPSGMPNRTFRLRPATGRHLGLHVTVHPPLNRAAWDWDDWMSTLIIEELALGCTATTRHITIHQYGNADDRDLAAVRPCTRGPPQLM